MNEEDIQQRHGTAKELYMVEYEHLSHTQHQKEYWLTYDIKVHLSLDAFGFDGIHSLSEQLKFLTYGLVVDDAHIA